MPLNKGAYTQDRGPAPCPQPGRENGIVMTFFQGMAALWHRGRIYTRDESQISHAQGKGWAKNLKMPDKE